MLTSEQASKLRLGDKVFVKTRAKHEIGVVNQLSETKVFFRFSDEWNPYWVFQNSPPLDDFSLVCNYCEKEDCCTL